MNRVVLPIVVFTISLFGQVADRQVALDKLTASLQELQDSSATLAAHRDRINKDILALAEQAHRPSMLTVATFTEGLTRVLTGKQLSDSQAARVAREIDSVLRSAGLGTWKFKEAISNVTAALTSFGVNATAAKKVATDLEAIGNEVRGPEGTPIRRLE